jgi:hypothetical protein
LEGVFSRILFFSGIKKKIEKREGLFQSHGELGVHTISWSLRSSSDLVFTDILEKLRMDSVIGISFRFPKVQ